jgi:Cullin family
LFESFYIDITRSFYAEESAERSASINVDAGEFISHVVSRVKEEKQRATALLPPQSWSIIEGVAEKALLDCRLHDLASKGIYLDDHEITGSGRCLIITIVFQP